MYQQSPQNIDTGNDPGLQEMNAIINTIAPNQMALATAMLNIVMIILGWLSITLEVFMRYRFGERYLSILRIWFAASLLFLYQSILFLFPEWHSPKLGQFILLFIFVSIGHRIHIWWRTNQQRSPWHSLSFGVSLVTEIKNEIQRERGNEKLPEELYRIPYFAEFEKYVLSYLFGDWGLYRFLEPVLGLLAGMMLRWSQTDPILGNVIIAASLALFIKNNLVYFQHRLRVIQLIDARIEGKYFNEKAFRETTTKADQWGMPVMDVVLPQFSDEDPGDLEETVRAVMSGSAVVAIASNDPEPKPSNGISDFAATLSDTLASD